MNMKPLRILKTQFRALFRKEHLDAEMHAEILSHIGMQTEDNIKAGMSEREARRAALRAFGWVESLKEQCRGQRGTRWLEDLFEDIKFALRQLRKNPGFTSVAVITLALGIGANTTIFSVVSAVVLRPLPFPESDRLVWLSERGPNFPSMSIAYPNFVDWQKQQSVFEHLGVYNWGSYNLTGDATPQRLAASQITATAWSALRVAPALGRLFGEDEDKPGAPPVLLLSHKLWVSRFGASSGIINRSISLDGRPWTIIGVMPANFEFPTPVDIWIPLGQVSSEASYQQRDNHPGLLGVARLKSGVSTQQARAELDTIATRLEQQYPDSNRSIGVRIDPLLENRVSTNVRVALWAILGAVSLVLLIASANVANLLLARAATRQKEMSLRAALGAGRGRIVRQLLTESLVLAVAGAGLAWLLAGWGLDLIRTLAGDSLPRVNEISLDARVLGFTAMVSLLTGLLFGLAPAWQATLSDVSEVLKSAAGSASAARARLRQALVVGEVALTLLLLAGAGLMLRTFYRLEAVDPGFRYDHALSFRLDLPLQKYAALEQQVNFYQRLVEALGTLPGVQHVGVAYQLPLSMEGWESTYLIEGQPDPPPGQRPSIEVTPVSPDYFRAMGIRLLRGRYFTEADNREHLRSRDLSGLDADRRRRAGLNAIIVDEEFVRRHFPNADPIGRRVRFSSDPGEPILTIVGVVSRVKMEGLAEQGGFVQGYLPLWQYGGRERAVVLKTATLPASLVGAVEHEVRALDPDLPIYDVRTLANVRRESLTPPRLNMSLLGLFAGLSLALAAVGLYGVVAYTATQRTREIGIRMALGAQRADVLRLVLTQGAKLTAFGILVGLTAAAGLTHLLTRLLFQVAPLDPLTFTTVPLVLGAVALLACWLPARRATRLNPMGALKYE
jgi:putative ABC transport system permease protein